MAITEEAELTENNGILPNWDVKVITVWVGDAVVAEHIVFAFGVIISTDIPTLELF